MFGENLPPQAIATALVGLLALLLVAAAVSDWRTRSISNALNGAIALLAIPFWLAIGLDPWPQMAFQVAVAVACFALFAVFFAFGAMGGGDVKLIAALALWMPLGLLLNVLLVMAVLGGVLSLAMWAGQRWGGRSIGIGIPYGLAIAAAGIWGLHQQYINHFA
ncbi:MAG: peptidase [Sphingomonadales bacterium]|nr:peptidase [Sphingomonadales bacterium]